jgi:hypothetical protein
MNTVKKTITAGDKFNLFTIPGNNKFNNNFDVSCNFNDTSENLNISITDNNSGLPTTVQADGTVLSSDQKLFGYEVNSPNTPQPIPNDQVTVTTYNNALFGNTKSIVYQFSVDYSDFTVGENIITLYWAPPPAPAAAPIFTKLAQKAFFLSEGDKVTNVKLERPGMEPTNDIAFWQTIQNLLWGDIKQHTLRFFEYEHFIDTILGKDDLSIQIPNANAVNATFDRGISKRRSPFIKSEEYNLIKFATNFYMLAKFNLDTRQLGNYLVSGRLPYYDVIVDRIKDDESINSVINLNQLPNNPDDELRKSFNRLYNPIMIELIWSYWMEQGMLVQTMNVVNLRFQNIKGNNYKDPLTRFDTDPLRPLSYMLWGYIQDEQHRLSLPRRLNEYDHEYGLTLVGRAVPRINPLDTRVKFLEAFHSLLTLCTIYFKESDDTTRIADAFPILNSLKEVHLLLAEGNHNAYGNLTWTARQEMLMQQYILSRPEMREFLGGRVMVPYPETWMDRVDTMRNLQGWGGTGIVHYYELAIHGELILLSVRYGNWSDVTLTSFNAANWAQAFRNSIQRYIHAYRSVAGIDLAVDQVIQLPNTFAVQPSYLIQQRLLEERSRRRA